MEILRRHISKTKRVTRLEFCIRDAFMAIMTQAKFYFNQLMLTLIFGIWASALPGLANDWKGRAKAERFKTRAARRVEKM